MKSTSLLVVDLQNDFCPGGALPVRDGHKIVPVVNMLIACAESACWPIFASRCWHPETTSHFNTSGGQWPPHCVQGTRGAELHPKLKLIKSFIMISKGTKPNEDAYSAFDEPRLPSELRKRKTKRLIVCGLATDYCVKATALDARRYGFEVALIENACAAVNINPDDGEKALAEMQQAGVVIETFAPFAFE